MRTALPRVAFLLASLTLVAHAAAADADLASIQAAGEAIFAKDRAAWLATDRLAESDGGVPGDLLGWVTVPADDGWQVFFVHERDGVYCTELSVFVDDDGAGPLGRAESCGPLTSNRRAMFLARQTAASALRERCSDSYNTVVLPYEGSEADWTVYLLAATVEPGRVVVGGHVRVLVGEGGTEVVDYRPLSKSCLVLTVPPPGEDRLESLVATHVLDDHPIETHVFLSLLNEVPFFVLTESALWSVDQGEIRLLLDGEEFEAYMKKAKEEYERSIGKDEDETDDP